MRRGEDGIRRYSIRKRIKKDGRAWGQAGKMS